MPVIDFRRYVQDLQQIGFLDVILPFLLFFTILYAALQKTRILGDKDAPDSAAKSGKKYNIVVSLVVALLIVIPHVVYGRGGDAKLYIGGQTFPDVVDIVNNALPSIAIWIVAILMLMLILGLFAKDMKALEHPLSTWISVAAVIIVAYVFGAAAGWWGTRSNSLISYLGLNNPDTQFGLLLILIFAVVLYFIIKEPGTENYDKSKPSLSRALEKWLGGD